MKNMLGMFVIAVTALLFGSVSIAQDKMEKPAAKQAEKTEKAAKAKTTTATGEVTSVDPKSGQLTVKVKDKELNLNAETKAAKSSLEKVKPGDTVRVTYTEKDGKMVATSVKAADSKTKTKTAEKAEKKQP